MSPLRIFVGYDAREAIGFPVFCHSVLERTRAVVSFIPVRGTRVNGSSTAFDHARWDIPRLCSYQGLALWAECDMLCRADIADLFAAPFGDVALVKHDYRTRFPIKFLGQKNEDYPRKNWSSLMLMDCGAAVWQKLDEVRFAGAIKPGEIHRFPEPIFDQARITALPAEWNHLVSEYPYDPAAKIAHFTIGLPCFAQYATCDYAPEWRAARESMLRREGA